MLASGWRCCDEKHVWSRRAGKGLVKSTCCISLSPELEALTGPSRLHNEQFTCGPPLGFPLEHFAALESLQPGVDSARLMVSTEDEDGVVLQS